MTTPEDREAAFIGKITASATHELRNVLAIVKESAGLIEDIMRSSARRDSLKTEKVMRAVDRIRAQVKRGSELLTSLNRFAHSMDHAEDEIALDQAVEQVAFLCQRGARQGNHAIEAQPGDEDLSVVTNPLLLQMALSTAVECCLEQLQEGGTVTLLPDRQGDRPAVEFNGAVGGVATSLAPTEAAAWERLEKVLDRLGASVERIDSTRGFRVVLSG